MISGLHRILVESCLNFSIDFTRNWYLSLFLSENAEICSLRATICSWLSVRVSPFSTKYLPSVLFFVGWIPFGSGVGHTWGIRVEMESHGSEGWRSFKICRPSIHVINCIWGTVWTLPVCRKRGTSSEAQSNAPAVILCSHGHLRSSLSLILFLSIPFFQIPLLVSSLAPFEWKCGVELGEDGGDCKTELGF